MGRLVKIRDNKPEIIEATTFEREVDLQEIVKRFPEIIPLDEIDEEFKPIIVIGREFPVKEVGSIDLLGIDILGLITIIEFKLEKNSDIRKVVAQTIEYAANLWEMTYDNLDNGVRNYLNGNRCAISELKGKSLSQAVEWQYKRTKTDEDEEFSHEEFIKTVTNNLQKGEFRLIIFCDKVDDRTKRTVEYLNWLSRYDIYCASADFFEADGAQFIKPYLITKDRDGISGGKQHAGKISFEEYIESIPQEFKEFANAIAEFHEKLKSVNGFLSMGTKGFGAYFFNNTIKMKPFEAYPHHLYLASKNYVLAKGWNIPEEALNDFEARISSMPIFKDSFRQSRHWHRYSFNRMTIKDLKGYFDFLFDWYNKWFPKQ